ncbi:MAG: epoxyqueuosine reductase QueH [Clostridia bacterium]|nr:epoxyqueuosine reductase QueH [Clostridia bacterium]
MHNDYNKLMKEEISCLDKIKPRLLVHVCCAPCSSACLSRLSAFDITLYYYNPNTYPLSEYDLRADEFKKFEENKKVLDIENINYNFIKENYNHNEFLSTILGNENDIEGGKRCEKCIKLRLKQSFEYAKANNFDYVTTTLTISPHKNAEYINKCGKELEQIYGVKFLCCDFKKENGYLNSINLSKSLNLYRQDYCGCEFSIKKDNN